MRLATSNKADGRCSRTRYRFVSGEGDLWPWLPSADAHTVDVEGGVIRQPSSEVAKAGAQDVGLALKNSYDDQGTWSL